MSPTMSNLRDHYNKISNWYEILDWSLERFRYRKLRPLVWSHAQGKTLDLGVGTGLNIPYYSPATEMTGVDISDGMLRRARVRAEELGVQIKLFQMDATDLKFKDGAFDSVVSTFLFCVLSNEIQPKALQEVHRVLAPDGKLILMEYGYSQKFWRRLWMKAMAPWVRWLYWAGFDRRTLEFLKSGNWKILTDSFIYQDTIRLIVAQKH